MFPFRSVCQEVFERGASGPPARRDILFARARPAALFLFCRRLSEVLLAFTSLFSAYEYAQSPDARFAAAAFSMLDFMPVCASAVADDRLLAAMSGISRCRDALPAVSLPEMGRYHYYRR